jgi:hypothetical protein
VTASRLVTIPRLDGDVTIPCPAWCNGESHQSGELRQDITHTGDDVDFVIDTDRGPALLFSVSLESRPFVDPDVPPGRGVFASVYADGDHFPHDPAGLVRLAARLVEIAEDVRAQARTLAELAGGAQ